MREHCKIHCRHFLLTTLLSSHKNFCYFYYQANRKTMLCLVRSAKLCESRHVYRFKCISCKKRKNFVRNRSRFAKYGSHVAQFPYLVIRTLYYMIQKQCNMRTDRNDQCKNDFSFNFQVCILFLSSFSQYSKKVLF